MQSNFSKLLLFIIFFCLSLCQLNAASVVPLPDPEITISMDFKNADLKDVIKVFSIQSGLNFIASEVVQNRKITLYLDKVPVKKAMDKIFKANNLTYELGKDENIFIVKDWGKPELDTITKVYFIKYRSLPESTLDKEKKILMVIRGTATTSTADIPLDLVNNIKQILSPGGRITEDPKTNSLIITDVPSRFKDIDNLIASLDVPQLQVMLDVEILDVSKNVVDKIGFEFGENPFTLVLPHGAVNNYDGEIGYFGAANSMGAEGAVTIGKTFAQMLDFLRTQTDTRYLARPKLLTLNNETAEISITKDEIVGYNEETTVAGTVILIKKTYIRSTELKLTPEGVGVFLRVTPQINPETKEITMILNPKSSVTSQSLIGPTHSDIELRTTKSMVKVKNGETIILGGLIHKDKSIINKKLPLLGDIPFIGALFRHKNQEKDKERELLIFITPRVIKEREVKIAKAKKTVSSQIDNEPVLEISRQEIINEFLNELDRKKK